MCKISELMLNAPLATGYIWASKRWSHARLLRMHFRCHEASRHDLLSRMLQSAADLKRLQALHIHSYEESPDDWDITVDSHLLSAILAHALELKALRLACHCPIILMPLGGLQHLTLSVARGDPAGVLSCITSARNLKTLQITGMRRTDGGSPSVFPDRLKLGTQEGLGAVSLRHVVPAQIELPQHCSLSVKVNSLENAQSATWEANFRHIKAFHLTDVEWHVFATDELPAILLREPPIRTVKLHLNQFGTSQGPVVLDRAVLRIPRLKLKSEESMHLIVGGRYAWDCLRLTAKHELDLDFDLDVAGPVHPDFQHGRIPDFDFHCRVLGRGAGVMELMRYIPKEATMWAYERDVCFAMGITTATKHARAWRCCCGACGS